MMMAVAVAGIMERGNKHYEHPTDLPWKKQKQTSG